MIVVTLSFVVLNTSGSFGGFASFEKDLIVRDCDVVEVVNATL